MKPMNNLKAPLGIHIVINNGLRIIFPAGQRTFRLKVSSLLNGEAVFDGEITESPNRTSEFHTRQTYFIPWFVEIWQNGQYVYRHALELVGCNVCINMTSGTLSDMIAWMPAVKAFHDKNSCRLTVLMKEEYTEIFRDAYPEFRFINEKQYNPQDYFATYPVGLWGYGNFDLNPTDFQKDNLCDHADAILGVHTGRKPPKVAPQQQDFTKVYGDKYVCIATRASKKMKQWNFENGWKQVADFLIENGYRVVCMDADNTEMPENVEDCTGKRPLRERLDLLRGCKFFIGLTSGLSWLAWASEKPVVMIVGYTEPFVEFAPTIRIQNENVCHGCFNVEDMRFNEFDKCPRNKNFECTRSITPEQVIEAIKSLPEWNGKATDNP